METLFNPSEKINDLIFENKNKVYGAYVLRKNYKDNLTIALLSTVAFFGLLIYLVILFGKGIENLPDVMNGNDPVVLSDGQVIEIPKPIVEKPKINSIKEPNAPKTQSGQMVASDNKKDVVNKTNDQLLISKDPNDKGSDSAATVKKDEIVIAKPALPLAPVTYVDEMPEFEHMQKYILENLRYPPIAVENGISGTVGISFVVELDGSLSDLKIVKGIGYGCEQEALRVVKTMKNWKPGKLKGIPQRVLLTLPVKFHLK